VVEKESHPEKLPPIRIFQIYLECLDCLKMNHIQKINGCF